MLFQVKSVENKNIGHNKSFRAQVFPVGFSLTQTKMQITAILFQLWRQINSEFLIYCASRKSRIGSFHKIVSARLRFVAVVVANDRDLMIQDGNA